MTVRERPGKGLRSPVSLHHLQGSSGVLDVVVPLLLYLSSVTDSQGGLVFIGDQEATSFLDHSCPREQEKDSSPAHI